MQPSEASVVAQTSKSAVGRPGFGSRISKPARRLPIQRAPPHPRPAVFTNAAIPAPPFCKSLAKNLQKSSFFVSEKQTPFLEPCYTPSMTANQQPIVGHDVRSAIVARASRPCVSVPSPCPVVSSRRLVAPEQCEGESKAKAGAPLSMPSTFIHAISSKAGFRFLAFRFPLFNLRKPLKRTQKNTKEQKRT